MTQFVYHGSPVQNLTEISPIHRSVFATKDKTLSALFIMRHGPWSFLRTFGHETGHHIPFFVERYKSMFDDFYQGVSGSIYVLGFNQDFKDKSWCAVSDKAQKVVQEIKIPNVKDFLLDLERQGKFIIYRYPNRPSSIPSDDGDLIDFILRLPPKYKPQKISELHKLLPDLYQRNKDKLENNN